MTHKQSEKNGKNRPNLDPKFVVKIEGKEFVTYQGLLDVAHQHCGLTRIETEILQYPSAENGNAAVVRAVAEGQDGEFYADIGDANPANCTQKTRFHIIRMASTRAKARALRDFTNVGMTAIEELCDDSEAASDNGDPKPIAAVQAVEKPATPASPAKASSKRAIQGSATLSEAQTRAIDNLCRRRDIHEDQLQEMAMQQYGVQVEELNPDQAGNFIRRLQAA